MEELREESVVNWTDIGYTVKIVPDSHVVKYFIYEIAGLDEEENILWTKKDWDTLPDFVSKLEDAELFLHGEVKWDTCSNWYFDAQDDVMLHFCTREQLENIGVLMTRCYDITKDYIGSWDGD